MGEAEIRELATSSPAAGYDAVGYPSGQRGQTVNLVDYQGLTRNHLDLNGLSFNRILVNRTQADSIGPNIWREVYKTVYNGVERHSGSSGERESVLGPLCNRLMASGVLTRKCF